jgi:predicted PurR-regulated permease PerM
VVLGFVSVIFAFFSDIVLIFFLAWLLAFILTPPIARLRDTIPFMSRAGAIFTVYFVLFGGLVILTLYVATALVSGISDFIANVPTLRSDLPTILAPWQHRLDAIGIIRIDVVAQANAFLDNLSSYATQLSAPLQSLAVASLGALGNLLFVIVLSLYMVADRDRLVRFLFWLVPAGYKEEAKLLEEAVARSFGGFLRGQAITGIVYAGVALLTSLVFNLDYIAITTAASGLLMAIPFFGPFVSWLPPVLVAFIAHPEALPGTLILMVVGWLILMNALQPRIMADALRIHPIVVLGAVLAGIKIAGIPGAIFGIPIAAVLSALFLHLLRRGGTDDGPVAARAARRVGAREGRVIRAPREPDPSVDVDV